MAGQFPLAALALAVLIGSSQLPATSNQAQGILAEARQAIGGDARLKAVRTLSGKGVTLTDRKAPMLVVTNFQLDFLLPDRFLISFEWPMSFFRRVGGYNGEDLIEQRYLDAVWTDARPGDRASDAYAWQIAARRRECMRYLVAWLLMAPEQYAVEFTDGTGIEGGDLRTDIVDAKGANDFAARLYFDKITHRLLKLTYREPLPNASAHNAAPAAPRTGGAGEPVFRSIEGPDPNVGEVTMQFADHHTDDGILFPHRMRIESEGLREEWQVSRFKVNPPLDAKYFERK